MGIDVLSLHQDGLGRNEPGAEAPFLFGASLLVLITASFDYYGRQAEKIVTSRNVQRPGPVAHRRHAHVEALAWWEKDNKVAAGVIENLTRDGGEAIVHGRVHFAAWRRAHGSRDPFEVAVRDRFLKAKPAQAKELDIPEFEEAPAAGDQTDIKANRPTLARVNRVCAEHAPQCAAGRRGADLYGTGMAPSGQVYSDTTQPLSEGDIIAIAKVTIPTGPSGLTRQQLNWNLAIPSPRPSSPPFWRWSPRTSSSAT